MRPFTPQPEDVIVEFASGLMPEKRYKVVKLSALAWTLRQQGMWLDTRRFAYALLSDSGRVLCGVEERELSYYRAKAAHPRIWQPMLPLEAAAELVLN